MANICLKAPEDKQDKQPAPNIDHLLSNIGRPGMPGETCGEERVAAQCSQLTDLYIRDMFSL